MCPLKSVPGKSHAQPWQSWQRAPEMPCFYRPASLASVMGRTVSSPNSDAKNLILNTSQYNCIWRVFKDEIKVK